jgi:hypothetical protein
VSVSEEEAGIYGWEVVLEDISDDWSDWPQHDPLKLGRVLEQLAISRS